MGFSTILVMQTRSDMKMVRVENIIHDVAFWKKIICITFGFNWNYIFFSTPNVSYVSQHFLSIDT